MSAYVPSLRVCTVVVKRGRRRRYENGLHIGSLFNTWQLTTMTTTTATATKGRATDTVLYSIIVYIVYSKPTLLSRLYSSKSANRRKVRETFSKYYYTDTNKYIQLNI